MIIQLLDNITDYFRVSDAQLEIMNSILKHLLALLNANTFIWNVTTLIRQ
jgi:hypothetical protein